MKERFGQQLNQGEGYEIVENEFEETGLASVYQPEMPLDRQLFQAACEKLYEYEPISDIERFNKTGIQESLEDIGFLLEADEDGCDATSTAKLIAVRGLEEIEKTYPLSADVGIDQLKNQLAADIKDSEGFGIEEVVDMDALLEQSHGDVDAGIRKLAGKEALSGQELATQQEKMLNYLQIKREVERKRAELMQNSAGFYGGYAQKIKQILEGAGEKLDAKMANSRLLKAIGEKRLTTRFSKVAAASAIVMAGGMMMLNPAESEAAEADLLESLEERPGAGNVLPEESDQEIQAAAENPELLGKLSQSQEQAKEFIKDLGIFSQIKLIGEIKENAEQIKAMLHEGSETETTSKNLAKVLEIYSGPLAEAKEANPELYQQEIRRIYEVIDTIKNSSLRELKSKLT